MILSGVIGVGIWHVLVNFSVWFTGLSGLSLVSTYIAAIPFDLRLLASTILFSSLFYLQLFVLYIFHMNFDYHSPKEFSTLYIRLKMKMDFYSFTIV